MISKLNMKMCPSTKGVKRILDGYILYIDGFLLLIFYIEKTVGVRWLTAVEVRSNIHFASDMRNL